MYSSEAILKHIAKRLKAYTVTAAPKVLSGGLLNYVWFVEATPMNIVFKQTPAYIASQEDIPLDASRATFEARALAFLNTVPWLTEAVRAPRLIDFDPDNNILIMEAINNPKSLSEWLTISNVAEVKEVAQTLGHFMADLHRCSFGSADVAEDFQNHSIQNSRYHIHYNSVAELFETYAPSEHQALSQKLKRFGRRLEAKGKCLIMGDLWLPSMLIEQPLSKQSLDEQSKYCLRIIDWEFAHYGFPEQDIAHLLAHLWMLGHMSDATIKANTTVFSDEFTLSYKTHLADDFPLVFNQESFTNCGIHFGAELMARAVGQFKSSYIYQSLQVNAIKIQEVITTAKTAILTNTPVFNNLRTQ